MRVKTVSEDSRVRAFIEGQVEYTSKMHEGISLVHLDVTRSQSGEGKVGNFQQGPDRTHWCAGHLEGGP